MTESTASELDQLDLLARLDQLVARLEGWVAAPSPWEPLAHAQALLRRLLVRVGDVRLRLESPLVVATFGGTGTGKSSLVNALVGAECTRSGRMRPTTTRPVLIVHRDTPAEALGLPLDEFDVVRTEAPGVRDIVLIDCPDPDTTEEETPASNLARLHRLLPRCDVLLYVSTQQKYRSARILDELADAAAGCRLLFVQTHADVDEDIRADWRKQLDGRYEVPDVFFVDSVQGLRDQQQGRRPTGDLARLQDVLRSQLARSQRVRVRRANLVDLVQDALRHCRTLLQSQRPAVRELETAIEAEQRRVVQSLTERLQEELRRSRGPWERRLIDEVATAWGFSPFSAVLRAWNGLGGLLTSLSLFRARNSAQVALIGALQGAQWLRERSRERDAADRFDRIATFGLDDDRLLESQLRIDGYARAARFATELSSRESLDRLRDEAARMESQFLGDAGRRIDVVIADLARANGRFLARWSYELAFAGYLVFVAYRVGRNFFYDSFVRGVPVLPWDFYVSAGLFFALWTGLLLTALVGRLRRGLDRRIAGLATELAQGRLGSGLVPQLEAACRDVDRRCLELDGIAADVESLRADLSHAPSLGGARHPPSSSPLSPSRSAPRNESERSPIVEIPG